MSDKSIETWSKDCMLTIVPTLACNIRCSFCYQDDFNSEPSLSRADVFNKLRPIYDRLSLLQIFGGEPTIVPWMKEYVQFLNAEWPGMVVQLITNGVKLDEEFCRILGRKQNKVNVSLNASNAHAYMKSTRMSGAVALYGTIYKNLQRLRDEKDQNGDLEKLDISMVVTPDSIDDCIPFIKLACQLDVGCVLTFASEYGASLVAKDCWDSEIERVLRTLFEIKHLLGGYRGFFCQHVPVEFLDQLEQEIESEDPIDLVLKNKGILSEDVFLRLEKDPYIYINRRGCGKSKSGGPVHCQEPWRRLLVEASGNVRTCCYCYKVLGNINHSGILDIFNGADFVELRAAMIKGDYSHCYRNCRSNRNPLSSCLHEINVLQKKVAFLNDRSSKRGSGIRECNLFEAHLNNMFRSGVRSVAIYGAGQHTMRLLALDSIRLFSRVLIVDDFSDLNGKELRGYPVFQPSVELFGSVDKVLISSDYYEDRLFERCVLLVDESKIVKMYS